MHQKAIRSVAIIGGGFSGALQAINLLRHAGPRAVLIERRPQVGRGVAYSAADPALLLNVRAGNMSALPDQPGHFAEWLGARGLDSTGFVPRMTYGEYLSGLLEETRARAPDRLEIVQGEAVRVGIDAAGATVTLADGRVVQADAAVLAMGNLPPSLPAGLDPEALPAGSYISDPWDAGLTEGLSDGDELLIIGTGLTMVDAVLLLEKRGFRGTVTALSRRGLAPRGHEGGAAPVGTLERPPIEVTMLLREVRARAEAIGWRAAVDELRPFTQSMWLAATDAQRARFLRHLRPWWEVHRHRIAPAVEAQIAALRTSGRLRIVAGRTLGFAAEGERVRMRWRPRGQHDAQEMCVARVINCSGPQVDLSRTQEPLLRQLRNDALIAPDAAGLGLAVDAQARVIGADGRASDRLHALGPMTRGTFWEITAVPDIRVQSWMLARRLSNAHWVGGEGL